MNNHQAKIKIIHDLLNRNDMLRISKADQMYHGVSLELLSKNIESNDYANALITVTQLIQLASDKFKKTPKGLLCEELLVTLETHLFHLNLEALGQKQVLLAEIVKSSFGREQHNTSIDFSNALVHDFSSIERMKDLQNNIKLEQTRTVFKNYNLIACLIQEYIANDEAMKYAQYIIAERNKI